jgi:hypothetical protein
MLRAGEGGIARSGYIQQYVFAGIRRTVYSTAVSVCVTKFTSGSPGSNFCRGTKCPVILYLSIQPKSAVKWTLKFFCHVLWNSPAFWCRHIASGVGTEAPNKQGVQCLYNSCFSVQHRINLPFHWRTALVLPRGGLLPRASYGDVV